MSGANLFQVLPITTGCGRQPNCWNDFRGLLGNEEIWHELAKLELKSWNETVQTVPSDH